LTIVDDTEQLNGGEWIIEHLKFKEDPSDPRKMDVSSIDLPLPSTELIPIFKSMHYCKLLSPFRALEWIYVDSQYKFGGYNPQHTFGFLTE
jgi:hypothetical protein